MVCPVCIAIPVAVSAIIGSISTKQLRFFQITLALTFIGIMIFIYFNYKKNCKSCNKPWKEYINLIKEKYFEKV